MPTAEDLRQRAMTAVRAGNFAGARTMLERARERAGSDRDQQVLIGLSDAYVEAELHGAEAGLHRCASLLGTTGLSPGTRGRILSQLALLHLRAGDAGAAETSIAQAIPLLGGEPEHLGRAYLTRGNLHLHRREPLAAVSDFEQARDHYARADMAESSGKAEHNIGYAHLLLGDLVTALRHMDDAKGTLSPMTLVMQSTTNQDRAEVMLAAGRPREAARALEAAAAAYGAQGLRRFQAESELVLAKTLLRQDPARARTLARRAARRFARHGSPTWSLRADALAVVAEIEAGGRSRALLTRADELIEVLRLNDLREEADQLGLVTCRLVLRRGDGDLAAARLSRLRVNRRHSIAHRLLSHEVRADLAMANGQHSRARREVTAGLATVHAWQSSFGSLDLQSTLVGHGRGLAGRGLDSALGDGRPHVVYEWSERARALVSRVAPVRPPPDEAIASDLTLLRQLPEGDRTRLEVAERIARHSWAAPGGGEIGEPAALDELMAGLGSDAALVAYVVRPQRTAALVVTDGRADVVPLGDGAQLRNRLDSIAADLDMAASRTDGPMAEAIRASLARNLAWVGATLVEPVLPFLGDRRVVLTPSGGLAGTPWSLLPGLVGRPLTIAPSATRWLELHADAAVGGRVGLVAGPRVERAEEEVTRACHAWPEAEALTGGAASSARVAELAQRVDLLHLAGHGRHSGENPLFSAVELADGPWFGYDIDALGHTPQTVVLSACELGRVSVRSGEEAVGMTAAWLHAGARHVLSSPALVADQVACDALARWHALVAGGAAPAVALAAVGDDVRDGPPLPFLCFGAGW
jgi:tetratricopeptide (TPR) repeat protein